MHCFLKVDGIVELLVLGRVKHGSFAISRESCLEFEHCFMLCKGFAHDSWFFITLEFEEVLHLGVCFLLIHDHLGVDEFLEYAVNTIHLITHLLELLCLILGLELQCRLQIA